MNTAIYYWDALINHYRDSQGNIMQDYVMLLSGYSFPPSSNIPLWSSQGISLQFGGNPLLLIGLLIFGIFIIK